MAINLEDRAYEQTWFRIICGHKAPPRDLAYRQRRIHDYIKVLISLADEHDTGRSVADIAREFDWSVTYTKHQLDRGRMWRVVEAEQGSVK